MITQIKGYENYTIDTKGDVVNLTTKLMLKGSIGVNGYKYYRLSLNNKKKMFYAHRLVAEAFIPNPSNLPVVNHKDGNKLNNNIDNLEWVTYSDNTKLWHLNTTKTPIEKELYILDLPNEEWKPFKNYLISSYGRVRHKDKNYLLHPSVASGYYKVTLSHEGIRKDYMIHHLVWLLFSNEDRDKNMTIDHIDGNKLNNYIGNLRQISKSENVYAALYQLNLNNCAKLVRQYDLNGNIIADFPSTREAARALNLDASTISKVCRGQNKTHGGFIFKYLD